MGPKNSRFGAFIKILKVAFDCQSPCQQLCPRAYFFKMLPEGAILWVRKTPVLGHL